MKAEAYYQQALADTFENLPIIPRIIGHMGQLYVATGQIKKGIDLMIQSIKGCVEIGNHPTETKMRIELGWIYSELGMAEKAITQLEKGLNSAKALGYKRSEAIALGELSLVKTRYANRQTSSNENNPVKTIFSWIQPPSRIL
jgi:tetratricopeptide (TPR) repeat protein